MNDLISDVEEFTSFDKALFKKFDEHFRSCQAFESKLEQDLYDFEKEMAKYVLNEEKQVSYFIPYDRETEKIQITTNNNIFVAKVESLESNQTNTYSFSLDDKIVLETITHHYDNDKKEMVYVFQKQVD